MDSACLSDSDLLALSEGRLGAEQHAPLHRHLARCSACMLLVTAVADTELADAAAPTLRDLPESEPEPESGPGARGEPEPPADPEPPEPPDPTTACGPRGVGPMAARQRLGPRHAAVPPSLRP